MGSRVNRFRYAHPNALRLATPQCVWVRTSLFFMCVAPLGLEPPKLRGFPNVEIVLLSLLRGKKIVSSFTIKKKTFP